MCVSAPFFSYIYIYIHLYVINDYTWTVNIPQDTRDFNDSKKLFTRIYIIYLPRRCCKNPFTLIVLIQILRKWNFLFKWLGITFSTTLNDNIVLLWMLIISYKNKYGFYYLALTLCFIKVPNIIEYYMTCQIDSMCGRYRDVHDYDNVIHVWIIVWYYYSYYI